jgi:ABC-type branched-subunit amino acid transport system ATPase component
MISLEISKLTSGYHKTTILRELDFVVPEGSITCLLGRNGVGKSTLMKTVMGLLPVASGSIKIGNESMHHLKPFQIAKKGVAYGPQEAAIFPQLTVEQNLSILGHSMKSDHMKEIFKFFPRLSERLDQKAGTLSGGEQKMLIVTRALLSSPKLMLLDEVSEGVQPSMVDNIGQAIMWANKTFKTTVLVVEQHLEFSLGISNFYAVMNNGSIVDEGVVTENETINQVKKYMVI